MGHPQALAGVGRRRGPLAVALLLALLTSCASTRWWLQRSLRSPGEELVDFPEAVWQEYDCGSQKRPFFMIERNELVPPEVRTGGEFNHRLVYVMCPVNPTEVVTGRLATRIRHRGAPIVVDLQPDWELKPGRWVVDAMVELPEGARPGIYSYELAFESEPVAFEKSLTFVVRDR
jgi:hypothetical protein